MGIPANPCRFLVNAEFFNTPILCFPEETWHVINGYSTVSQNNAPEETENGKRYKVQMFLKLFQQMKVNLEYNNKQASSHLKSPDS
jgi:hypothetical protein